jgi:hypothetical protein
MLEEVISLFTDNYIPLYQNKRQMARNIDKYDQDITVETGVEIPLNEKLFAEVKVIFSDYLEKKSM